MQLKFCVFLFCLCFTAATPAWASDDSKHKHAHTHEHGAHVHGLAKLDVAVEANTLNLHLATPLEGVLGFEHAPRNDKERAAVLAMRQKLNAAATLFAPTSAAQCVLASVQIEAPSLEAKAAAGHADLDAHFLFNCAQADKLTGVEVRLFKAFPNMRRIDAQVVSAKGQKAKRLSSRMRFLSW
jgi:hypothetical protein